MATKKSSKFLSGALVGAALGIAAGIFATSKTGKKMQKDAKEKMADFYADLAPKLKKAKAIGEKEYQNLIGKALKDYNKDGKIDEKDLKYLAQQAKASWKHLKKHL